MLEASNIVFKKKFVSIRLGLLITDIKGKIDATPIISSKAIIKIITINKNAFLRSLNVKIDKIFLIFFINYLKILNIFL